MINKFRSSPFFLPIILLIALPLFHLYSIQSHPSSYIPIVDSGEYIQFAKLIESASFSFINTDHLSMLYTWFVAVLLYLFNHSLLAIKLAQVILNCITALLLYASARMIFQKKVAILSLYMWALYCPIIFFTGTIMSVSLILFFYVLSFYSLQIALKENKLINWGVAGIIFALAALTRPDILIFALLICVGIIYSPKASGKKKYKCLYSATLFLFSFLSPLIIVGALNHKTSGEFTIFPTASGINFYMGNNPDYIKTISTRAGPLWDSLAELPFSEDSAIKSISDKNSFYYKKVFEYALNDPGIFLNGFIFKLRTLVNGYELPAVFDIYALKKHSPLLSFLVWDKGLISFPFGLLLPLACLGWRVRGKKSREEKWLLVMLISFLIPLLGFWNSLRFRIILVPWLILYASFALNWLWLRNKDKQGKELKKATLLIAVLIILFNWPYFHFTHNYNFEAEMLTFAGIETVYNDKNIDDGVLLIRSSLKLQNQNSRCVPIGIPFGENEECNKILAEYHRTLRALSYSYMGDIFMINEDLKGAIANYTEAIRIKPDYPIAYNNLGTSLLNLGKSDIAKPYFEKAIALRPQNALAHNNLGKTFFNLHEYDKSIIQFKEVIKLDPENSEAYNNLSTVYSQKGDMQQASDYLLKSLNFKKK